ncbi:MAG TPA: ATP-binding protein, partial [Tepidisphaeraceae bacterium]|nr:ATP-binding protein [Tepidisphaeraceae bacterium]
EAFESEYRLRRGSDGSYRWFLCRAVGVRGKDGKNVRWFGSCTDIENQKRSQQERESLLAAERRARSDLIRASRVKDEFLATLSHELRTPMTAILGWARLLRDPKMREKNLERGIEAIDASAKAQARLIEDLLDMNRILTGKLALQPELVDFRAIVRQAVTAVQPAASNKQISLTTELDDTEAAFIEADPARLQQVVWNILTNAVKFTPVGGTVEVRLQSEGGFLRLTVKDSGRGIKQSFLPHVFERFRQADGSTTREFGGLGLGLAIVRSLVEMHGGTVAADSPGEGLGATFTVELPLRTESTSEVTSEKPRGSMVDRAIIKGKRVLAVDDDFAAGSIIRTILESGGAEVQVVLSAAEALALLRQQEFDLLLSDIGMPEMDGYGLRREVSKLEEAAGRKIPTMALTAFARAEDRAQALAAGFDAHLAKPIYPNELLAAVAKLLESR